MSKTLFAAVILIFLAVSCSRADEVIKLTEDPFGPGAKSAEEKDPRLSQKVSFEAKRKTVCSILTNLSKTTKITFLAGWNNQDWQVRDRKMTIAVKDMPLSSLMQSIARVMKFKWTRREKDGSYYYRLYMDRKVVIEAERQEIENQRRFAAWRKDQREKVASDIEKSSGMSDADLQRMKEDNPYMYEFAKEGWSDWLAKLFSTVPQAKQAWINGEQFGISFAQLPEAMTDATVRMVDTLNGYWSASVALPEDMDQVSILLTPRGDTGYSRSYLGIGCGITWPDNSTGGYANVGTALMNPEDEYTQSIARRAIAFVEQPDAAPSSDHKAKPREDETYGDPVISHPDDPELLTKVKLKMDGNRLSDLQTGLAKTSQYQVVSDYFASLSDKIGLADGEHPIKDILSQFDKWSYNWEKVGSNIEFRDRHWFLRRSWEIPEARIEPWRQEALTSGTLDIDALAEIGDLSSVQVLANVQNDDVLGGHYDLDVLISQNRELLDWYHHLDSSQKAQLFSKNGIDLRAGTVDQVSYAKKMLWLRPALLNDEENTIRMSATRTQQADLFHYVFTATSTNASKPMEWKFTTPKFEKKAG